MRGLNNHFLDAMRDGIERGRRNYYGWDKKWEGVSFECDPIKYFLSRLHDEIDELVIEINNKNKNNVIKEAADVANFAMFIADILMYGNWYDWSERSERND